MWPDKAPNRLSLVYVAFCHQVVKCIWSKLSCNKFGLFLTGIATAARLGDTLVGSVQVACCAGTHFFPLLFWKTTALYTWHTPFSPVMLQFVFSEIAPRQNFARVPFTSCSDFYGRPFRRQTRRAVTNRLLCFRYQSQVTTQDLNLCLDLITLSVIYDRFCILHFLNFQTNPPQIRFLFFFFLIDIFQVRIHIRMVNVVPPPKKNYSPIGHLRWRHQTRDNMQM